MDTQANNLFIVDSNRPMVIGLEQYLSNRFGSDLAISTFPSSESCLSKLDSNTSFVILAHFLKDKSRNEILKSIKLINPQVEVMIHSSNEDIGTEIDFFCNRASDYSKRGDGVTKYFMPLIITFALMGAGIYFALSLSH